MHLSGSLGVNLHFTDRLFSQDIHFVFSSVMSNNYSFNNAWERLELWKTDRFVTMKQIWKLFISNLNKYAAPSEYLSTDKTLCLMRHQVVFREHNQKKPHRYAFLLKSLNDARFPYTYKSVSYAAKV